MSLRTRLALVFIAATLIPLGATVWVTTALLDRSLRLSPVDQLSGLSRSRAKTGREFYQQACEQLKADALAGRATPTLRQRRRLRILRRAGNQSSSSSPAMAGAYCFI